jgi:GNAT superfamily N-acetyltransferase
MAELSYREDAAVPVDQHRALYDDLGWTTVTARSDAVLARSVRGAQIVCTCWEGERLVGLFRAITDGSRCGHVLDLVVCRDRQGRGIGSELFRRGMAAMADCDYVSLMAEPAAAAFYERFGFFRHSHAMLLRRDVHDATSGVDGED